MRIVLEKSNGEVLASIPERGLSHVYKSLDEIKIDLPAIFNRKPNKLTPDEEARKMDEENAIKENVAEEEIMLKKELKGVPIRNHTLAGDMRR